MIQKFWRYFIKVNKNTSTRELFSGSAISVFSKISELLVRYGFIILLSRIAGSEEMGRYALTIGTIMTIVALSSPGINIAVLRLIAPLYAHKEYAEAKSLMQYTMRIKIISSVLISAAVFLLAQPIAEFVFTKAYLTPYFRAMSLTILPFVLIQYYAQAFRGIKKIGLFSLSNDLIVPLFNVIFLAGGSFFFSGGDLIQFFVIASPISAVLLTVWLWNKFSGIKDIIPSSTNHSSAVWEVAKPILVSAFAIQILSWADVFFIGRLYPDSDMALYNVANKIAVFIGIPLIATQATTAATLSINFKDNNMAELEKNVQKATFLTVLLTLPVSIGLVLLGKPFLSVFGADFVAAYPLLLILLAGQLVNMITGPTSIVLTVTNRQKLYRNILIAMSILSLLCNALLIPPYGIIGAAWSIMIVTSVKNIILFFVVKKYYGFYTLSFNFVKSIFTNLKTA